MSPVTPIRLLHSPTELPEQDQPYLVAPAAPVDWKVDASVEDQLLQVPSAPEKLSIKPPEVHDGSEYTENVYVPPP